MLEQHHQLTLAMKPLSPVLSHASVQEVDTIITSNDGLLHHPYLDTLHLVVNEEFHFLVCQMCSIALYKEDVIAHLTKNHLTLQIDQVRFMQAITDMMLAKNFPSSIVGPRNEVHGLSIQDAFACDHCSKLYLSENTIRSHHHKQHKNIPKPHSWRQCRVQGIHTQATAFHSSCHLLWEISTKDIIQDGQPSREVLVESLLKELDEEFNVPMAASDERRVTPWLMTTRWHEYIASAEFNVECLCNMVAIPKDNDHILPGLRSAVNKYFHEALDLLPITDELVLKRLNSPSPIQQ